MIEQIEIIKSSLLNCNQYQPIILGDFNLDYECKNLVTYRFKNYFDILEGLTDQFNLMQMIPIPTWQRIINGNLKESILDHVYVKNPLNVKNLKLDKTIKVTTLC